MALYGLIEYVGQLKKKSGESEQKNDRAKAQLKFEIVVDDDEQTLEGDEELNVDQEYGDHGGQVEKDEALVERDKFGVRFLHAKRVLHKEMAEREQQIEQIANGMNQHVNVYVDLELFV